MRAPDAEVPAMRLEADRLNELVDKLGRCTDWFEFLAPEADEQGEGGPGRGAWSGPPAASRGSRSRARARAPRPSTTTGRCPWSSPGWNGSPPTRTSRSRTWPPEHPRIRPGSNSGHPRHQCPGRRPLPPFDRPDNLPCMTFLDPAVNSVHFFHGEEQVLEVVFTQAGRDRAVDHLRAITSGVHSQDGGAASPPAPIRHGPAAPPSRWPTPPVPAAPRPSPGRSPPAAVAAAASRRDHRRARYAEGRHGRPWRAEAGPRAIKAGSVPGRSGGEGGQRQGPPLVCQTLPGWAAKSEGRAAAPGEDGIPRWVCGSEGSVRWPTGCGRAAPTRSGPRCPETVALPWCALPPGEGQGRRHEGQDRATTDLAAGTSTPSVRSIGSEPEGGGRPGWGGWTSHDLTVGHGAVTMVTGSGHQTAAHTFGVRARSRSISARTRSTCGRTCACNASFQLSSE
ncbi:hypothetical protein SUDANB178_07500 [Streptomyces sp. enrichment culture]